MKTRKKRNSITQKSTDPCGKGHFAGWQPLYVYSGTQKLVTVPGALSNGL